MALIEWNESFSVGVAFFDMQHKQLIGMLNELHDAINAGKGNEAVVPTLQRLSGYWFMHFTAEEQKMKELNYPDFKTHQMEHVAFASKVKEFKTDFSYDQAERPTEILNFLKNWFVTHIAGTDLKYKEFFNSQGMH